jgi:peptide/nickel transport system substrate-binding protein
MFGRGSRNKSLLTLSVVFVLLGACTTSTTSTSGSKPTLVINSAVAPTSLDLSVSSCGSTDMWATNFYRQLVVVGRKPGDDANVTVQDANVIKGDLAQSWTVSTDGTTYTFKLDPKSKFLDGTPIYSAAVKFSAERAIAKAACGSTDWEGIEPDNPPTISTPDATTVVLQLKRANSQLLPSYAAAGPTAVYEPSVVTQHPDTPGQAVNEYLASHIAGGGGPFILDKYIPNQLIQMHANPNYNGPTPAHSQKVVVNFGQSESTLLLQARSSAADVTVGLGTDDLVSLENSADVKVLKFPVQFYYDLGLLNDHPPFNNQTLRQALAYAVPYDQLVSQVARGYGVAYYGVIAQTLPGFNATSSAPLPFDLAKAKSLIAQSGVKLPLNVKLEVEQGDSQALAMATVVQSTWKQLGVNLTIDVLASADYNTVLSGRKEQAYIRIDGPGATSTTVLLSYDASCPGSTGIGNRSKICIPELDQALAKLLVTTDPTAQQQLYDQITTLWRDHYPKIILYNIDQGIVISKKVKHFDWSDIAPAEVWGIEV